MELKIIDANQNYNKITRANMETYLSASAQVDMLKSMIIGPFEKALKEDTSYNNENIPKAKIALEKRIGNHNFKFDIKPSTNPKYGEVYDEMNQYLSELGRGNSEGRRRDGVRTTEEGTYILLDDVIDNLNTSIDNNTEPSVEIKIKTSNGKDSQQLTRTVLELDYTRDYSIVKGEGAGHNARNYIEAKKIVKNVESVITKPFDAAVKEQTGFSKENIPADVEYSKNSVGNVLCYVVSSPSDSVKYAKVMDGFINHIEVLSEETTKQKSAMPELKRLDGRAYVNLANLTETLDALKDNNTTETLRQNVKYLRKPKDDKIIVE